MNRDVLSGSWRELRGKVKERWGKLTDDDVVKIEGHLDRLIGAVQKRYGYAREQAEREIDTFLEDMRSRVEPASRVTSPRDPAA
jgi:uncharacterized protein YjbJ (UPF0337 family)